MSSRLQEGQRDREVGVGGGLVSSRLQEGQRDREVGVGGGLG